MMAVCATDVGAMQEADESEWSTTIASCGRSTCSATPVDTGVERVVAVDAAG